MPRLHLSSLPAVERGGARSAAIRGPRRARTAASPAGCFSAEAVPTVREVLAEISAYINSHAHPERNRKIAEMVLLNEFTIAEAAREVGVSPGVANYVIKTLRNHILTSKKDNPPST